LGRDPSAGKKEVSPRVEGKRHLKPTCHPPPRSSASDGTGFFDAPADALELDLTGFDRFLLDVVSLLAEGTLGVYVRSRSCRSRVHSCRSPSDWACSGRAADASDGRRWA